MVSKRNPGGGLLSTTQVNLSSLAVGQLRVSASWTPNSGSAIANTTSTSTTVSVAGAAKGDFVVAAFSELGTTGVNLTAHVSADNTVTVVVANLSGASVTLPQGTLYVLVFKGK